MELLELRLQKCVAAQQRVPSNGQKWPHNTEGLELGKELLASTTDENPPSIKTRGARSDT